MKNRLVTVDILRAICIILVVVGHYSPANSPVWYKMIHDIIYAFHMPAFMFASGYIYYKTYRPERRYGSFVWGKIKRLMVPYFVTSAIVITIKLLTERGLQVEHPVTAMDYLSMFWYPSAGYFLWFIWALFLIFLIVPLFRGNQARIVLFIVSLAIGPFADYCPSIFCINKMVWMMQYFMFGVMVAQYRFENQMPALGYVLAPIVFVAMFVYRALYMPQDYNAVGYCVDLVLAFAGIVCVCELSRFIGTHFRKIVGGLVKVGIASYIIYLFHTTFEGFAKAIVGKIPILVDPSNSLTFAIGAIVIIVVGVIIPYWLYGLIGRSRITSIMFGLKYTKRVRTEK